MLGAIHNCHLAHKLYTYSARVGESSHKVQVSESAAILPMQRSSYFLDSLHKEENQDTTLTNFIIVFISLVEVNQAI